MSGQQLPSISGEFGIVKEPELNFTQAGRPWAKIRGVAKSRRYNQDSKQWEDGDSLYIDILCNGKMAENTVESVYVGDSIYVGGKLSYREWKDAEGNGRHSYSIQADSIAVSMRWEPQRTSRVTAGSAKAAQNAAGEEPQTSEPPF